MRPIVVLALVAFLGGCHAIQAHQTRESYNASRAAYKACLTEKEPSQCERERLIMEADERAHTTTQPAAVLFRR